jgi:hypothetical protein
MRLPAALCDAAICAVFLALSWAFYAPPWPWPGLTYFGAGQDPLAFIWFLNWVPFALAHHLPLLFTTYADSPAGADLAWKTSVPALALLAAPFTNQFGAVAVFNVFMIAAPALAGFCTDLAAAELTRDVPASLAAGLLFTLSGYEVGQSLGHLNLAFCAAVPVCLWAGLRATSCHWPTWKTGLVFGALLLFEFGVSAEIFASLIIFGLVLVLLTRPRILPGLAIGVALCLVLAAPVIWHMIATYHAAVQTISAPKTYSDDLLALVTPTPLVWPGGLAALPIASDFTGNFTEQGGYFGLPLLALMGAIIWRDRRPAARIAAALFLLGIILALGPRLHVLGHPMTPAPWRLLSWAPLLHAILPCRMILYAWLAAAMLAALWLSAPGASPWRFAVLALCLLPLIPAQSRDRNWTHLQVPSVFAAIPAGEPILIIPLFADEMGWQYATGMKFRLVGQGYLGTGRPVPFKNWPCYAPLWENRFDAADPREFAAYLAAYGVKEIVLLPQGYSLYQPIDEAAAATAAAKLLTQAGWRPVLTAPDGAMYRPAP